MFYYMYISYNYSKLSTDNSTINVTAYSDSVTLSSYSFWLHLESTGGLMFSSVLLASMPCQQFQNVDFTCRIQQITCSFNK